MKMTALMAGLLAGLIGTAALAQDAAPGAAPQPPAGAEPPPAPPMGDDGPMGPMGRGPMGGRGVDALGLAPLPTYDTDGNGIVTQAEIEAKRSERFATADADGDGALSPQELIALEDAIRQEMRLARAAEQIRRMDDNGDSLLQTEEMEARTPRLAPLFDRLDTDGDDGISLEEMQAGRPGRGEGPDGGFGHGGHGRGHRD
ncbi:EF-hand domain-containing protein [Rubellimicrobium arenae]|uniref:EF-hand domain-containing protein n=1 Tax=Rubellimicrobium arenae TaxID=2817372 RepID=UPI001B30DFC7|nr:EF-hand domain-containing protein [Rubellimicrobium arenae]